RVYAASAPMKLKDAAAHREGDVARIDVETVGAAAGIDREVLQPRGTDGIVQVDDVTSTGPIVRRSVQYDRCDLRELNRHKARSARGSAHTSPLCSRRSRLYANDVSCVGCADRQQRGILHEHRTGEFEFREVDGRRTVNQLASERIGLPQQR